MPSTPELGPLLRSFRRAAGLTLEELAASSGVSARAISDMERGYSKGPQSRTIAALAQALHLDSTSRTDLLTAASAGRRRPALDLAAWTLPAANPAFVGRRTELASIAEVCEAPAGRRVVVISGVGGLGKSALAVQAAHQLTADFPDGVIFVALRGLDEVPVAPEQAAIRILNGLGIRGREVPPEPDQRMALVERTLGGIRVLLVLDNASGEAQVRQLLPHSGLSAAIVTSRRVLSGLNGAAHTPLSPLSDRDSVALLDDILGPTYNTGHVPLAALARVCGRFPLAIRIAANRLLSRPGWTVQTMVDRLSDTGLRLDRLSAGDLRIQTAFAVSYAQLNSTEQLLFRRLSLMQAPDWSVSGAAVLAGLRPRDADLLLDELVELGLLNVSVDLRYSFHDLVRLFAQQCLADTETAEEVAMAAGRHRNWLLATAIRAGQFFEPTPERSGRSGPAQTEILLDADSAENWLLTELENWVPALRDAATAGDHTTTIDLAESMHWFSDRRPHLGVWQEVFERARNAAEQLGQTRLQAVHTNYLSWVYKYLLRNPAQALSLAEQAFELADQVHDLEQQAWAKYYAAEARLALEELLTGLADATAAAGLFHQAGNVEGYPDALLLCTHFAWRLEQFDDVERLTRTVTSILDAPDCSLPANIVDFYRISNEQNAAMAYSAAGRWQDAEEAFQRALLTARRSHLTHRESEVLYHLADMLRRSGELDQARASAEQSATIAEHSGDQHRLAAVRRLLGELALLSRPGPTSEAGDSRSPSISQVSG